MSKRPNILLIHSDQHRYDCLGCAGHPIVKTPHLDRLAAEGVRFTRAYTPAPICSPARASLMTGTWPTTHGCITIPGCCETFQPARADLPNLYQLASGAGYRLAHVGKYHRELQGVPTDHGVEKMVYLKGYKTWREAQGLPPVPADNGPFGETDPHITPEQSPLAWQADQALDILDDFAAGDAPFLLRWDPPQPHLPNRVPEPYASMYPPADIPPWSSFPDPLENKPSAQRNTRQRWGVDEWSWAQWQPIVSRYLGEVSLLDAQIGRLLARLDELGLAENTLVIYSTDHSDMCGAHGMMDKHYCMYEDILRVPLIVRYPGQVPAGTTSDALAINELDIARTLLDTMDIPAPESFLGQNLLSLSRDESPRRASVFSQYFGTQQGLYSARALVDARYKYVYNPAAEDELYDLDTDPAELTNLAPKPEHAHHLQSMRERMGQWMADINDPLSKPLFRWGEK